MHAAEQAEARELHRTLDFIGLRAHAATVGLIQLCEELLMVGILDAAAIERIKDAIHMEISVSRSRMTGHDSFDDTLKTRLDAIFPQVAKGETKDRVGSLDDLAQALEGGAGI